jgi:hypothetical protein
MLHLQEAEDRKAPEATTWASELLLRVGKSREFLGLWINSGAIHEAKRSVLLPMWKVATRDRSTGESTM